MVPVCNPGLCCPVYSPLGYGGFGGIGYSPLGYGGMGGFGYAPIIGTTTIVDPYMGGGFIGGGIMGGPIIGGGVTEVYDTGYGGGGAVYDTGYI
jgi:hypothetical protein